MPISPDDFDADATPNASTTTLSSKPAVVTPPPSTRQPSRAPAAAPGLQRIPATAVSFGTVAAVAVLLVILAVLVSVAKRESPTPHHAPERASERAEVSLPPSSEVSSEQAFDGNGRQKVADQNDVTVRGVEGAEQRPEASNEPKIAVLHTTAGQIGIRFFPEKAPKHVRNFIALAEAGFYDGTKFHRIIPGFMIQGGDPNTISGDTSTWGTGGSGKLVPAEFNDVYHRRGIVSMARAQDPNGASSQFFICVAEARFLDRKYSVFGEVVDGMEVVDTIVRAPRDRSDRPNAPTTIERITMRDAKDYSAVTETSTGQENHVSERRTERASDVSTIGSATAQDEPPSNGGDTLAEEGRTTPARVDAGTVASSTMKGSPPAMPIAPSARQSTEVASPNDASVESLSAVGHWRGNVKQFLAPRYSVVLSLAHGKIGTYVGTIEYPEVNCSGDLTLLDAAPGQVRISEIITSGRCVSGGTIVISNIRSNTAEWAWYNKNGRRQATSHITRLESGERR